MIPNDVMHIIFLQVKNFGIISDHKDNFRCNTVLLKHIHILFRHISIDCNGINKVSFLPLICISRKLLYFIYFIEFQTLFYLKSRHCYNLTIKYNGTFHKFISNVNILYDEFHHVLLMKVKCRIMFDCWSF